MEAALRCRRTPWPSVILARAPCKKDLRMSRSAIAALSAVLLVSSCATTAPVGPLAYQVHTGGPKSFGVTSTIIYGPAEALLVDAQFNYEEAGHLADSIDRLGRRLTTIFITHPDPDHYVGLA